MKSIVLFLSLGLVLPFFISEEAELPVDIEILDIENLDFSYDVKFELRRKQVIIKCDEPLKTLAIFADQKELKTYHVEGSNLVLIPIEDFKAGTPNLLKASFDKTQKIIHTTLQVDSEYGAKLNL